MEKLLRSVAASKEKMKLLKIISVVCAYTCAVFFGLQLALHLIEKDYILAVEVAVSAAVGFVFVTVFRHIINAPRPYEIYDFYEEKPKSKPGHSFPSRHTYSAFVIATLAWLIHPAFSVGLAILAVTVAVTRVVTGIHFIRDVLTGAFIGIIAGVAGILCSILI